MVGLPRFAIWVTDSLTQHQASITHIPGTRNRTAQAATMSNRGIDAPLAVQMDRLKKSMNSRDKRRDQDRQQRLVQSLLRPPLFPGQGTRLKNPLPTPLSTAYCALCWPEAHSDSGEHSSSGPVRADHTCQALCWWRQLGPWRRCSSSCGKRCRTGGATTDSVRSVPGEQKFR